MSLLDNLPHEATIQRTTRAAGTLGGSKTSVTVEQTAVACWEQKASEGEILRYQKKGMRLVSKIYFASDPAVTERHQIIITSRNGVAIASPITLEIGSESMPDATVGKGLAFKTLGYVYMGEDD